MIIEKNEEAGACLRDFVKTCKEFLKAYDKKLKQAADTLLKYKNNNIIPEIGITPEAQKIFTVKNFKKEKKGSVSALEEFFVNTTCFIHRHFLYNNIFVNKIMDKNSIIEGSKNDKNL